LGIGPATEEAMELNDQRFLSSNHKRLLSQQFLEECPVLSPPFKPKRSNHDFKHDDVIMFRIFAWLPQALRRSAAISGQPFETSCQFVFYVVENLPWMGLSCIISERKQDLNDVHKLREIPFPTIKAVLDANRWNSVRVEVFLTPQFFGMEFFNTA